MSVGAINPSVASTSFGAVTKSAGEIFKTGFDKVVLAIKQVWDKLLPFLKDVFTQLPHYMRTAAGVSVLSLTAGVILGLVGEKVGNNNIVSLALKVSAAVCFIGAGVAFGYGLAAGFTFPIF